MPCSLCRQPQRISCCSPRPWPCSYVENTYAGDSSVAFHIESCWASEHLNLRHLSDTSQSTPDRTRYICTLWLSLPIHVNAPPREARDSPSAASHETQSPAHAATPGTCGCHQPIVPPNRRVRMLANNLSAASPRPLRVPATRPLTTVVQHQTGPWSICCNARVALTTKATLTCA